MKRGRKILKMLLLTVVMVMTMVFGAVAAGAEEPEGDRKLIDKNWDKGSITVTKYAYDNNVTPTPGIASGTTADATAIGQSQSYKPLAGAKFVLYQIADESYIENYYNGSGVIKDNDRQLDLMIDSYVTQDSDNVVTGVKDVNNTLLDLKTAAIKGSPEYTGNDGKITFSNVKVGLYVLVEVASDDHADQIVAPLAEPSIVSVPMVNTDRTNGKNADNWIYDIYAYPKNPTAEGNVELTKKNADESATLDGVTFKLEKTEDETISATTQWKNVESESYYYSGEAVALNLTTDASGQIKIEHLPAGLHGTYYRLTEISVKPGTGYIVDPTPIVFKVNPNNTIEYVSGSQVGDKKTTPKNAQSATDTVQHTEAKNNLTLVVKNYIPDITKEVLENKADSTTWKKYAQYSIGAVAENNNGAIGERQLQYKITVKVPDNLSGLAKFEVKDTPAAGITDTKPTAIKYDNISIDLSDTRANAVVTTLENKTDYANGFIINFDKLTKEEKESIEGKEVTITYDAFLNKDAIIAKAGNENNVQLTYDQKMGTATGDTATYKIVDSAVVYTFSMEITKTNADNKPLGGVVFELHKVENGSDTAAYVMKIGDGNGNYRICSKEELEERLVITTQKTQRLTTNESGNITINGLENNTYYLKEIETVKGYNLLSKPVAVKLDATDKAASWKTQESDFATDSNKIKNQTAIARDKTTAANDRALPVIINRKGFTLPQTGTFGYLSVFAIGALLMLGGIWLMFSGRKKKIK